MNKKRNSAYLIYIGSMLIYGTIGIFRRYIPLESGILACVRGFVGALVLLIFVKARGGQVCHGIGMKKILLLALSGGLMGCNWLFLFEAYNYTTVAIATLCYYMQPTIIMLLSPLLFGERLTTRKSVCVVLSVAGMILVSGVADGGGQNVSPKGILFGLAAAVLYASVVILNKKVEIEDAYEKTIIQLLAAAVVMMPYLLLTGGFTGVRLTAFSVVMLLIVGVVHTGVAYAMYFGSMQSLPAQSVAVMSYIDPVSALIFSAILLREAMSISGILGAVLIIGSAMISELKGRAAGKQAG